MERQKVHLRAKFEDVIAKDGIWYHHMEEHFFINPTPEGGYIFRSTYGHGFCKYIGMCYDLQFVSHKIPEEGEHGFLVYKIKVPHFSATWHLTYPKPVGSALGLDSFLVMRAINNWFNLNGCA